MLMEKSVNTIFELHSAMEHNLFKAFFKRYEMPEGLKHRHIRAMIALYFNKKMIMSEVSSVLNIEKGSFTTVADKLIDMGYVVTERSTKDRRVYELSLTEKGTALTQDFLAAHRAYISQLFDQLEETRMATFSEALEVVTSVLMDVGDEKFKTCCNSDE
ncbi:MAG: winged helix DNA-binding protein [Clostridia bacterium]|nr:winged helix DNA-binding protein [Clostridia bacterium]